MIESVLTGLLINIIAEASKKYNISQTYLIAGLCFFIGLAYTIINEYNPDLMLQATKYTLQSLWVAQAVYMFYTKLNK